MTNQENHALFQELHSPRGRVILTFLKELATENALLATHCNNADEAFAFSMRAKGQLEAHQKLEIMANTPLGDYVPRTD